MCVWHIHPGSLDLPTERAREQGHLEGNDQCRAWNFSSKYHSLLLRKQTKSRLGQGSKRTEMIFYYRKESCAQRMMGPFQKNKSVSLKGNLTNQMRDNLNTTVSENTRLQSSERNP